MADDLRDLPTVAGATPPEPDVRFDFDGQAVTARAGEPIGVALFAAGLRLLARSPKYHRPRGLFCLDGHCGSCFVRVDGQPNLRACMTPARAGLVCERQNAFPDADVDLLRAADWLFPDGMDHHRLMTGTRLGNDLFVKLVRQMGGTGTLPDAPASEIPDMRSATADVCVVGGGPAGLAAARALTEARPGSRVILIDEQSAPGGSWLAEAGGPERGRTLAAAVAHAGAEVWLSSTAIAYYPEDGDARELATRDLVGRESMASDGPPGILAVVTPTGLVKLAARRFLYATGAYDQNLPFPDNDRPGILSARACGRLVFRWGVRPGRRLVALAGDGALPEYAARLMESLRELGIDVSVAAAASPPRVNLKRDAVAVLALPAPASELPRQHGAEVRLDPERGGFAVTIDPRFATTVPGIFAAGDVTGYVGCEAAFAAGKAAGLALAATL